MTCRETKHFLALYDAFLDAECELYHFCWRGDKCFDGSLTAESVPAPLKINLTNQDEYDVHLTACADARVEISELTAHESIVAVHTLMSINLTLAVWDCVDAGEVWLSDDGYGFEAVEAWSACIMSAWRDALWLAGLQGDPRFDAKLIQKFHQPPVTGRNELTPPHISTAHA